MAELARKGKSQYQIMMREVSDTIQDLAMAYGERHAIEACVNFLSLVKNTENKKLMEVVFRRQITTKTTTVNIMTVKAKKRKLLRSH